MLKSTNNNLVDTHPVPGNYLTKPSDVSVGQVVSKIDIVDLGQRAQSGAYENCLTYGGINCCFDL